MTTHKGLIVGYRAPVLRDGKRGVEEKSPIHIADIVRMLGMPISITPMTGPDQQDLIRGILKQGHSATKESTKAKKLSDERTGDSSKKRRVRFALQELGRRGHEEPRRKAGERKLSTADDSECDDLAAQNTTSDSNWSAVTEHMKVHDSVLRHDK